MRPRLCREPRHREGVACEANTGTRTRPVEHTQNVMSIRCLIARRPAPRAPPRPRVPRRSQQQLTESRELAERLKEQKTKLEEEKLQALAAAAERAWQRRAASLSC